MDVSTVVVSACIGAAACAGAYVFWGPEQLWKRPGCCAGLVNLGNTCFLNAVLQALASLPEVRVWLARAAQKYKGRLAVAMEHLIAALADGCSGTVLSPVEVLQSLVAHRWAIDFQQQDAHELYHVLLMTLEEEMVTCPSLLTDATSLLEKELSPLQATAWTRTGCVAMPERPLVCPLQGLLTSELLCCHCQYLFPSKYECFDSLSLSLSPALAQRSLQSALLDFVKSEVVCDVECPQCSREAGKGIRRTFVKQLWLGRPPECLCIHFKRTVVLPDGGLCKDSTHISFPIQLDVGGMVKRKLGNMRYQLVAVVEHIGGVFSGHYVTYRHLPGAKHSQWVYTSDTSVYNATVQEVLRANAYMLFYRRITR